MSKMTPDGKWHYWQIGKWYLLRRVKTPQEQWAEIMQRKMEGRGELM